MKPLLNWFSYLELVSSNLWAVSLLETPLLTDYTFDLCVLVQAMHELGLEPAF